jgi:type I restriction enzyme, S subunit
LSFEIEEKTNTLLIPKVPASWKLKKLGDLGEFKNGVNFSKTDFGSGIPVINVKNLFRGRYATINDLDEIKEGTVSNPEQYQVKIGDLLFARSSVKLSGAGQVAMVNKLPAKTTFFSGFIIRFRPNQNEVDPKFLNYMLRSPVYRSYFQSISNGTTITNLTQRILANVEVYLPELKEQNEISKILDVIDNKIELNNQINKNLEEMAQAIFKSWFVDFEPFQDGDFVESELGMIPKGWEVKSLEEVVSLIIDHRGKTPKKLGGDWSESGFPAISAKNIKSNRLINRESIKYVSPEIYNKWMKDELQSRDIILTSEGPLGEAYYLVEDEKYCLSQRLFSLRADSSTIHPAILFLHLQSSRTQEELNSRATGSTVLGIRQSELRKVNILVPPKTVQMQVQDLLDGLLKKVYINEEENFKLLNLRDTLLPKLMSGEIRVPLENEGRHHDEQLQRV